MTIFLRYALILTTAVGLTACMGSSDEDTSFRVNGQDLHISGVLDSDTADEFEDIYAENPDIERLVLGIIEGSSDDEANRPFFYRVRELGLQTYLTSESAVYSGGSDLFISGASRLMEQGAVIGVHSWSDGTKDAADYPETSDEHTAYVEFTTEMLGSPDWYWFTVYAAPFEGMHDMTDEEIEEYGLLTGPVLPASHAGE